MILLVWAFALSFLQYFDTAGPAKGRTWHILLDSTMHESNGKKRMERMFLTNFKKEENWVMCL